MLISSNIWFAIPDSDSQVTSYRAVMSQNIVMISSQHSEK